jgi:hypothetical protein
MVAEAVKSQFFPQGHSACAHVGAYRTPGQHAQQNAYWNLTGTCVLLLGVALSRDDLLKQSDLRRQGPDPQRCLPWGCSEQSPHGAAGGGGFGAAPARRALPPSHRARMVGWMREVSGALGLHISTFFAAASILDRFVAAAQVSGARSKRLGAGRPGLWMLVVEG